MNVTDIDILKIIPQRPPFVMVDRLLYVSEDTACAEFIVTEDNIFVEDGILSEAGVVENIAQTCAAGLGYANVYLLKNTVKLGFLAALRDVIFNGLPKIGEKMLTQIIIIERVYSMTIIEANVNIQNEQIASGNMKIFITDIENAKENDI
jgi:predicted hotdog family 3-hydroxylacyl-ACP dehydratase